MHVMPPSRRISPRFTSKSFASFATHPYWAFHLLLNPDFQLANVVPRVDALSKSTVSLIDHLNSQFDPTVTWDDVGWPIEQWDGPFVIKSLLSVADAGRAADLGATAMMIWNHGGRQRDSAPAPVGCVVPVRDVDALTGDRPQVNQIWTSTFATFGRNFTLNEHFDKPPRIRVDCYSPRYSRQPKYYQCSHNVCEIPIEA